jgi:two-component system, chemotaxis family, CheB/CheR fusion protein
MASKQRRLKAGRSSREKKSRTKDPVKAGVGPAAILRAPVAIKPFPIVGLGASAGGLEALEKFLSHVPPDCDIGYVVVTHQHPGHTSLLPELLGKCTRMRVQVAANGVAVRPNTVYLSPSEGYLAILHGTLHIMEPDEAGLLRLPIDYFFRSLAEDQKEKAIGIVLSGTGTDGTLGLKAIKGATGMTMAQEPDSAKYSGMPSSAIATGLVDYVLPVERLPQRLIAYAQGPYLAANELEPGDDGLSEPLQKILLLLRARTGHDFFVYKASTIRRRIERRINVHQLPGPQQYQRLLQENPHELDLLFKELLIGVTHFFRDAEAFNALAKTVVPKLLASHPAEAPVRVWVAGCASGEEAYSLAMTLQEGMDKLKKRFPVQIFGTDLDDEAIHVARVGFYPEGIARDVRPQRLGRFFIKEDGGYRIKKEIREMVIFAPQNVLKDPPFTKLDLVTCRNLLIYVKSAAQARLLSLFHYALKPGGVLFLGTSESITGLGDHFTVMNKKFKIFERKDAGAGSARPPEFAMTDIKPDARPADPGDVGERTRNHLLSALIEKTLLTRYAPASVIVNDRGDILYIHGRTGDYLEPSTGQPRLNILEMAREGLRLELPSALRRAATQKSEVVREHVRVRTNGHFSSVRLTVAKLTEPESVRGLLLVTFSTEPAAKIPAAARKTSLRTKAPLSRGHVSDLERELQYTRETLQSTVEELQTSNEELKSTNEELQSTNEELQSANEELETSKEEMQSLNEELQTVNAQLQGKLDDLAQANDDMQNLLNSTNIATIFLDQNLRIKRFTAEATKLVKLIPSDVGRPIGDLASNLHYDGLEADASEVLRKLGFKEKEVQTRDGEWRQVRIHPYRTMDNVIDGLCITFVNINQLKSAELAIQHARDFAENIVATVRKPLMVLDEKMVVVSANPAFYSTFKTAARDVEHRLIYQLGDGQWNIPALRKLLEEILPRNTVFEGFKVEHEFPVIGERTMLLNARRLKGESGAPGMILLAFEDVTPGRGAEAKSSRSRKDSMA